MKINKQIIIRKTHRYLGLFIGIQFLNGTISGLYFSWNDINDVHGDHMRKSPHFISASSPLASPAEAINQLESQKPVDSIHSVQLIGIAGKPRYQIVYFSGHTEGVHHHTHYALADGTTGALRGSLTENEAVEIARDNVLSS